MIEDLTVYPNWDDLMTEYLELELEDIKQCLAFAAKNFDSQVIDQNHQAMITLAELQRPA